jgi:aspartate/methionine/tyrosine aminotransferase
VPYPILQHVHWAKRNRARYYLAGSMAPTPPPEVLGLDPGEFPGASAARAETPWYMADTDLGDPELQERIGARYGVDPARIVPTCGASEAHLLLEMLLREDGGDAACESPGYEPHAGVARSLPGRVLTLPRDSEGRFDLEVLSRPDAARVRVVVVTDPHNPTGMKLADEDAARLFAWAEARDAHVIVDEVFREADATRQPGTWATRSPRAWSVSSLTKGFGLGPLRLGWIIAPRERVEDVRRVQDYLTASAPGPSVAMARRVLAHADRARAWVLDWLERNRALFAASGGWRTAGTTAFVRVPGAGDLRARIERWRLELETAVVPGAFFGAPEGFRIGFGAKAEDFAEGWARVRRALATEGLAFGRNEAEEGSACRTPEPTS